MNSENSPTDKPATSTDPVFNSATENSRSSLLKFVENEKTNSGKDINTKITALDDDMAHLRAELGVINSSVEEGLDRLGDTDIDLTAKVSETYKRLGEIDNAYKSLLEISSRIDHDIQKLNGDVSTVAEQSVTGIKTLEQSSIAQSNEFSHKNEQVVSRVNHLVETSKLTGDLLSQKIEATTEKMLQMEARVVAEIDNLSNASKDKADAIEASVESTKAKILKLQSVDEAIIKRATTLEISSAELSVKSQDMQVSIEQLQASTSKLSNGLNELREQARALEDITSNHSSLISSLQKTSSDITHSFATLSSREGKHFTLLTAGLILLLLVTAALYLTQQYRFDVNDTKLAQQSAVLDEQITGLQQTQQDSALVVNDSLTALENRVEQMNVALQNKIEKEVVQLDEKVQTVKDQVQSVDGRLSQSSPFSQIGDDNIIHSAQWLAGLPAENFVVQLAYVDDANVMYEIAQRYNYYLKDVLSYFEVDVNGVKKYVLLSGNYATQSQAEEKIQSMPRYIDRQQPVAQKLADVQKYIAQK